MGPGEIVRIVEKRNVTALISIATADRLVFQIADRNCVNWCYKQHQACPQNDSSPNAILVGNGCSHNDAWKSRVRPALTKTRPRQTELNDRRATIGLLEDANAACVEALVAKASMLVAAGNRTETG